MDCLCQSRNCPLVPRKGDFLWHNKNIHGGFMITRKFTEDQLFMLNELVVFAYEMDVPEQKGWDVDSFDQMFDELARDPEPNEV